MNYSNLLLGKVVGGVLVVGGFIALVKYAEKVGEKRQTKNAGDKMCREWHAERLVNLKKQRAAATDAGIIADLERKIAKAEEYLARYSK